MELPRNDLDWSYVRAVLAVAETGSLTGAARRLRQSQPTLGRHIKAAEEALGTTLFTRTRTGFELTEAGQLLLAPARAMAAASAQMETLAAGRDVQLSGTVRITASVVVSHYILPPLIAQLREEEPEIEIELVPSDLSENLIYREADIAIRMYQPTQLDIITRKIADQKMALYVSHALLARVGHPETPEALLALPFVGFDRSDMIIGHMRAMGYDVDRHFFAVRCDDQAAFWRLVCAGCGVGAMQEIIGDKEPAVQRLEAQIEMPTLPVWLAAHEALRGNPRIRRVWDFLADALYA
ncbi:MAG: LysR family transcriptional regulator [Pseudomonadota bacterium]